MTIACSAVSPVSQVELIVLPSSASQKALAAASAGEADAVLAGYFAAAATAEVLTHAGNKAILQRALEAKGKGRGWLAECTP